MKVFYRGNFYLSFFQIIIKKRGTSVPLFFEIHNNKTPLIFCFNLEKNRLKKSGDNRFKNKHLGDKCRLFTEKSTNFTTFSFSKKF
jgi:hypothetical protein